VSVHSYTERGPWGPVHVRVFDPDTAPTVRLGLMYPHGPLANRAREVGKQFAIPKLHLPKRRLRAVIALGLFPILWVLPRCGECGQPWPCTPLTDHFRHTLGWAGDLSAKYKAMSTRRRRAKAAKRNPTAISHRARPRRRWRR
jgi:hypothetical protein